MSLERALFRERGMYELQDEEMDGTICCLRKGISNDGGVWLLLL